MKVPITFEQAKAKYVHRFTMDHIPNWALTPFTDGTYPAPHYASDREWFENTEFPTDGRVRHCTSRNQSFPLGKSLKYKATRKAA